MKWHKVFVAACVVAAGATLSTAAFAEGEEEAVDFRVTSDAVAIALHTDDAALRFSSAELAAKQVTYRAGETVTLTAPDGTTATVVADAAAAGGATLAVGAGGLSSDGLWRLDNSNGSVAFVGVAWETFGAAWRQASDGRTMALDTLAEGPDRKLKKSEVPPVAYSGDDWAVVATSATLPASTITFTPPEGAGLEATTWNKTGKGAEAFTFNAKGDWTVTLAFADGTTKTATITIESAGFMLIVR